MLGNWGAHVWGQGSLEDLIPFFPGFAFSWCTSFHASLSVFPEPYVFGLKGNMRSARKSWSQFPFYCRKASKWCEEGQWVWHLGLWERHLVAAMERGVSCQSCFPRVQTPVLMRQLRKFVGGKEMGDEGGEVWIVWSRSTSPAARDAQQAGGSPRSGGGTGQVPKPCALVHFGAQFHEAV